MAKAKTKPEYDLSFCDERYLPVFSTWLDYKFDQFREIYKGPVSVKAAYNKLVRLSGGNPDTASLIIENSIGNLYKGFFELKQQNGVINRTEQRPSDVRNDRLEANQKYFAGGSSIIEGRCRTSGDDDLPF